MVNNINIYSCLIFHSVYLIIVSFGLLNPVIGQGNPSPLIQNIDARVTVSLNGLLNTIIDPYKTGMNFVNGCMHDRKMENPWKRMEYNFDTGDQLNVPGYWNTQKDQLFFYEGSVWYKKTFDFEEVGGHRELLYFGAVNYEADVYLNGEKTGSHIGGLTPFNIKVTDLIQERENTLVVGGSIVIPHLRHSVSTIEALEEERLL